MIYPLYKDAKYNHKEKVNSRSRRDKEMTNKTFRYDRSIENVVFITKSDEYECGYKICSVGKWQAKIDYLKSTEIIEFLDNTLDLTNNSELRKMLLDEGYEELITIFDNTKNLAKDLLNSQKKLAQMERSIENLKRDLWNTIRTSKSSNSLQIVSSIIDDSEDNKWAEIDEPSNEDFIYLDSFYCQFVLDDAYLEVFIKNTDENWILKIEYPEFGEFDEEPDCYPPKYILSRTIHGILNYVFNETQIDIWKFIDTLTDKISDNKDIDSIRQHKSFSRRS